LRSISRKARVGSPPIARSKPSALDRERIPLLDGLHGLPTKNPPFSSYRLAIGRLLDLIKVLLTVFAKQLLTTF
jgi:hypothetical protein